MENVQIRTKKFDHNNRVSILNMFRGVKSSLSAQCPYQKESNAVH